MSTQNKNTFNFSYIIFLGIILLLTGLGIYYHQKSIPQTTSKSSDLFADSQLLEINLTFINHPPLTQGWLELWAQTNTQTKSLGKFKITSHEQIQTPNKKPLAIKISPQEKESIRSLFLTLEPENDPDPLINGPKWLQGTIINNQAELTFQDLDLSDINGQVILGTPTDGLNNNELSGYWFLNPTNNTPSLQLPPVTNGWQYQSWLKINNLYLNGGAFAFPDQADDLAAYSETLFPAPPFPGEDFLINPPDNFTFPLALSQDPQSEIVISLEPKTLNHQLTQSEIFQPLLKTEIPPQITDHQLFPLEKVYNPPRLIISFN